MSVSKQFGATATDVKSVALDSDGNVYIVGTTGPGIPLVNPIQSAPSSSNCAFSSQGYAPCESVFVAKFDPTGTKLLYSTYLGPTGRNFAAAMAVDPAGNAYIAGTMDQPGIFESSVFPGKAFLYKLNPSGSAILYHQVIDSLTQATSVAVDAQGNAYLAGNSYALDFPAVHALQATAPLKPIYVSNDAGVTWRALTSGLPAVTVYSLAFGQGAWYAASSSGLFRSTDTGITWSRILADPTRQVVADPHSSSVYATYADSNGSFTKFGRSSDGGATWTNITSGLSTVTGGAQSFGALTMDPTNSSVLWLAGISASSQRIYKSLNAGVSWQVPHDFGDTSGQDGLQNDPDQSGIAIDPTNASRVYLCCAAHVGQAASAVFRTFDSGNTWTEGDSGPTQGNSGIWPPIIDPHSPSTLWASWERGLVRTSDAGQTWSDVTLPKSSQFAGYSSGSLALDPSGTIYLVNDEGFLLRSADRGATWAALPGPWSPGARILAIDPSNPSTIYVGSPSPNRSEHAFVVKFDAAGNTLWATLLAGSQTEEVHAIATDAAGNAYVAGSTNSLDFPVVNALQPVRGKASINGSGKDAFISKIAADGSKLLFSTYLGGSGEDSANSIAVDASGNVYVAGSTDQSDFPVANAIQSKPATPYGASFVAKLDAAGSKLLYSTYLVGSIGSSLNDAAFAVAVDSSGAAWVGGFTGTVDFPMVGPIEPSTCGVSGYVARLSPSGDSLLFSSYLNIAGFNSGNLGFSRGIAGIVPISTGSVWLAVNGINAFSRLDLSSPIQPGMSSIVAIYNAGGYRLGDYLAPGELLTIFGGGLADAIQSAAGYPLPVALQGTSVTIGGLAAPLYYVAPGQINLQVPTTLLPGVTTLVLNRAGQSAVTRPVDVVPTAAGIFTGDGSSAMPIVVHATDFSLVTAQNPAHPGENLAVLCTGLGATDPNAAAGAAASALPVLADISVVLNSRLIRPDYAGLAPGYAGVDQVNFQIPTDERPGVEMLSVNGSNVVYFPVQ